MAECHRELAEMAETCGEALLICVAEAEHENGAMGCILACAFEQSVQPSAESPTIRDAPSHRHEHSDEDEAHGSHAH